MKEGARMWVKGIKDRTYLLQLLKAKRIQGKLIYSLAK